VLLLGDRPEVQAHLHEDFEVTRAKLDLFAAAPEDVRLLVVAELRRRVEDQEHIIVPTLEAAGLAIFAIFISITPDSMRTVVVGHLTLTGWSRWVTVMAGFFNYAAIVLVVLLPSIRAAVIRNRDRSRAAVWLAAYDTDATGRPHRGRLPL
jgi:hypothetical protein